MRINSEYAYAHNVLRARTPAREQILSIFSQLYHLAAYRLKEPKMQLGEGMVIVSVDIDVGNREVGLINRGKNDANVGRYINEYSVGKIEEQALPFFIDFFNNFEIPVTFAFRGQFAEVDSSILGLLLRSHVKHDIGSHGYYHRDFRTLSQSEAGRELNMLSAAMKKFHVTPRSFVFPYNGIAHLDLLEKHGYKCYRGLGGALKDGMWIKKEGQLYDIHPSFYLGQSISPVFLRWIIDISVERRIPFHLWFHPWNFGGTEKSIQSSINNIFYPIFKYAKKKEKSGLLTFETMLSATKKVEKVFETAM